MESHFTGFGTAAIHAGQEPEQWSHREVVPPISLSTTFAQPDPADPVSFDYIRAGNPTRQCLEKCLAALEGAAHAHCFSSGLGATNAIATLLKTGDHILCCDDVYGGTQRYFRKVLSDKGIHTDMVNLTDHQAFAKALTAETKLVWMESPTNPLLKVCDIRALVDIVRGSVAKDAYVVVDNTFMTPYNQRPLSLGADIVMHSMTKYLNGHSDVLMGAAVTDRKDISEKLWFAQLACGYPASAFDCFLANRGLKTLHVRMKAHGENGLAVAKFLEAHPKVSKVLRPDLPSHPQHEVHKKQARGMSGMVAFYIKDGGLAESKKLLKSLKVFTLAESLGGYESLAELPATMTHASVPAEERAVLGITDNLVRLSVGLEEIADLTADLDQALNAL